MTHQRDFDRVARAWLDLMPDEAPDRVLASVIEAVDRTPQVRRPVANLWRIPKMNRLALAVAAAAVIVVAVIGGSMLIRPSTNVGGPSPTPTPLSTPVATTGAAGAPADLVGLWLGGVRTATGISAAAGTLLDVSSTSVAIAQSNEQGSRFLQSAVVTTAEGQITLTTATAGGVCSVGDSGTYSVTPSASGETIAITAISDACTARIAGVAGTWWRADCKAKGGTCLGLLDAGAYGSQYLAPRASGKNWTPVYGGLTFTVPDGWANSMDWPSQFGIKRAAVFQADQNVDGDGGLNDIAVYAQPAPAVQDGTCSGAADSSAVRTVAGLVSFIRQLPGLAVQVGSDVTVGGLNGKVLDVSVKPGGGACPDAASGEVQYLAGLGVDTYGVGVSGTLRERLILLDLGSGSVAAIVITAPTASALDATVTGAMPIIESFRFN